jgi:Ca2+/Na+ antiporter
LNVTKLDSKEQAEGKTVEKISALNEIFENLISDASDLVKDLYWSVKMYLFFGLIMVLFGVQTLVYNIDSFQEQFYVPLFVAGTMLFAGSVQILNYFRLRGKYSRLFSVQDELKKT